MSGSKPQFETNDISTPLHVLIAAGGTGGHLFPAQALAEELQRRNARVELMTDQRGHKYGSSFPASKIYEVPSASLSFKPSFRNIAGVFKIIAGIVKAQRILHKTQPAVVIGFGGYPSLPPLAASLLQGIPTVLQEQNTVLGRVNRLFSRFTKVIATGFPDLKNVNDRVKAKIVFTGNPVRDEVKMLRKSPYVPPDANSVFKILVFGGSQGARALSEHVPAALGDMPVNIRKHIKVVQQARVEDMERVREIYARAKIDAEIAPFFKRLPERMAEAHLVIARSGASTMCELSVIGRPAVLVPLPNAIDNDQLFNARYFVNSGAGWLLEQRDLTSEHLLSLLVKLRYSPDELAAASIAAGALGKPDAVLALADLVEQVARSSGANPPGMQESEDMNWPAIGQVKPGKAAKKKRAPKTGTHT